VSLEWIPLFVLLWLKLVTEPTIARGIGAAVVLFLVILCDYYYFLYCVITGALILGWWVAPASSAKRCSIANGWPRWARLHSSRPQHPGFSPARWCGRACAIR
jgi:hypothetical protein